MRAVGSEIGTIVHRRLIFSLSPDDGTSYCIGDGAGVWGRVDDADVPLAMDRHFGHGGGRGIDFCSFSLLVGGRS